MWYLTMHSSKFCHIHFHFFPSNIMEQYTPFITTNPPSHAMDPTLTFRKRNGQPLHVEPSPVLTPYPFLFGGVYRN